MTSTILRVQKPASRSLSLLNKLHIDGFLFSSVLILVLAGLVNLYSVLFDQQYLYFRHMLLVGLGLVGMLIAAQIPRQLYLDTSPFIYAGVLCLLILLPYFGVEAQNSKRWLEIPYLPRFQPSELLKIAIPLMLAWYLRDKIYPLPLKDILVCGVIIAAPCALVYIQPDLGTTSLLAVSGILLLFLAGMSWKWVGSLFALGIAMLPVLWIWGLKPYQKDRIMTMFYPEADPLGLGWNIIQSKTALGSGGFLGKGFMNGTQIKLQFLPAGHTDFILAIIGEEWGFVGFAVFIGLFFVLFARCLYLCINVDIDFSRYAIAGMSLMFFSYVLANIMMVCGLLPVVGAPLPLVSYGGTSAVTFLLMFGVIMALIKRPEQRW